MSRSKQVDIIMKDWLTSQKRSISNTGAHKKLLDNGLKGTKSNNTSLSSSRF